MTTYSYTLSLSTSSTPSDCSDVTSKISVSPSGIGSLTMNPGDTLSFSADGSYSGNQSGTVTGVVGVEITSCKLGSNDVNVNHFFGDKDNTSTNNIDCLSTIDYSNLPLQVSDSAHADNTVSIGYKVWMKSSERLRDGDNRSFYYTNSLTLATVSRNSTVTISGTAGNYTLTSSPSYFDVAPYGKLKLTVTLGKAAGCDVNAVRFLTGNGSQSFDWDDSGSPSASGYRRDSDTQVFYDETNPGTHDDEQKYNFIFKAQYKQNSNSSWTDIQTTDPTICNEGT